MEATSVIAGNMNTMTIVTVDPIPEPAAMLSRSSVSWVASDSIPGV